MSDLKIKRGTVRFTINVKGESVDTKANGLVKFKDRNEFESEMQRLVDETRVVVFGRSAGGDDRSET